MKPRKVVTDDAIVFCNERGKETHRLMLASIDICAAAEAVAEPDAETYLSWSDQGVTLLCERVECMVEGRCPGGKCWYQEVLPYRLTPAMVLAAFNTHVLTHG